MSISGPGTAGAAEIWSEASAPMSPTQKMSGLFDQIDPTASGTITQAQFDQAFQTMNPPASFQSAGADSVWAKLDPNGTGSVSKQDFVTEMTTMMKQLRGHHHHQSGSAAGAQALTQNTSLLDALGKSDPSSTKPNSSTGTVGSVLDLLA